MNVATRPLCLVVAAMGGEGGGVLTDWIVEAANASGLAVQSTSVPGVAQRTGATTYYVEIFPTPLAELGDAEPILALSPSVGEVDLIVATELMEAARSVTRGWSGPDRTHLIASTHRVHAMAEKMEMGDGRYDSEHLLAAIAAGTSDRLLFDMEQAARSAGCVINAVLLGAVAGSGRLPIPPETFEEQIVASGKAVESNLKGFRLGLAAARGEVPAAPPASHKRPHAEVAGAEAVFARLDVLPAGARAVAQEGVKRLVAYQDVRYARLYAERLEALAAATSDEAVLARAAKYLAVRMSFEDVIHVARLKTAPERLERIRAEIAARPGQPVVVKDFLKPGLEEVCALLPGFLARPILDAAHRGGWADKVAWGRQVNANGILGYASLRLLAGLKPWRRFSHRFTQEQAGIEDWLAALAAAARLSPALGIEVAECARLIKGYGETWRRGTANFQRIRDGVIAPAAAGRWPLAFALDALANARAAALADPEGARLERTLVAIGEKAAA
ncbi:Putative Indolepyruvate oxidoreductase subunit B(Pyruvate/ketoisovalerate oxidoreductase, catalytic domain,16-206) [Magnetospirillum sp. XM-1]|uniref:indolepyruvate oxidoreductase subunit beta family protein n=1 Tax=Magnetospirillum sp. XM-1 TaxID=1663591 RepID=UPI00073DD28F|nr:indolepyruvate oxidoreductase subunit beta family protein [Magnetospirillum sp. XM-1]CUW38146.1 Putative Indolepyruvate oxidoreductase subunit B(Pyruvate/ketoisovalerate oxidoreductase, catalytic domain,16-206) [Magnetospirillum sp. XM-1]